MSDTKTYTTTYSMTIDGQSVATEHTIGVVNPATGEIFAEAPECSPEQLNQAMIAAQRAFETDWRYDLELRRSVMATCADALDAAAEEIGRVATMEQGMPLGAGIGSVRRAAFNFRRYADLEVPTLVVQDDETALVEVSRRPLGVIAAIKPWNVPVSMAVNTIAPAFRAGNTVVVKPSPFTPLATLMVGELLRDVVPAGTLNVVSGGNDVGQWMTEHPIPRGVSFTGSVATGKKVNTSAAPDLKRVLLELGGNDAAIVLDDVDPEEVAEKLFWRAFGNAGQICMAIKRIYVPEQIHSAVVDALVARARAVTVGNGLDEGVEMGPINNLPQYQRVRELVAEAIGDGAVVRAGGHPIEGPGYFFEPTILTGLAAGTRLVDEEQFGPALPVLPYSTLEEAIEQANGTTYGLGASVWSSDPDRAAAVAERLEAGTAWVNTHAAISHGAPFAGTKWSGLGSEGGIYSVYSYTDPHVVYRARSGANAYLPVPGAGDSDAH
ncbi:MAG: Aldehyde Dehydrogenase [Subtercola sp.]|nr:Aldehyde Dehydrogenase [Subtercola sp.]